jgi:hypothetical protein
MVVTIAVHCPTCHANSGEKCFQYIGTEKVLCHSFHHMRVLLAIQRQGELHLREEVACASTGTH